MYEYFCAFIIGVVEGLTEYIPVSSTGHMIIVGNMLNFTGVLADVFDVFIQLGAILSVIVVYRHKFIYMMNTHHWFKKRGASLMKNSIVPLPLMEGFSSGLSRTPVTSSVHTGQMI